MIVSNWWGGAGRSQSKKEGGGKTYYRTQQKKSVPISGGLLGEGKGILSWGLLVGKTLILAASLDGKQQTKAQSGGEEGAKVR